MILPRPTAEARNGIVFWRGPDPDGWVFCDRAAERLAHFERSTLLPADMREAFVTDLRKAISDAEQQNLEAAIAAAELETA